MAARFGRRRLFIACLVGFTVTSMMCGAAQTLEQMVLFRVAQGCFGAALVPLSQAIMLDIYPFERRPQAMAIWGLGVMVGPITGPTLGGYLTDFYNWRWVFYVNLPFGILATAGVLLFLPKAEPNRSLRFDWTGFAVLGIALGALQLMLDRGQQNDWFTSREIVVELVIAGLGFYLFLVHMLTAKKPFIPPSIFRDRNFTFAMLVMFSTGMVLLASSALLAPYLQNLAGYPVETAGLVMAPRGVGTAMAMILSGKFGSRVDLRKFMMVGVAVLAWSLYDMSGWTPDISPGSMVLTLVLQGFGMGMIFNPLSVVAYATLPAQFRADAAALLSLFRNIGAAIGISITSFSLTRNTQVMHEALAAVATPFNHLLSGTGRIAQVLNPATTHGAELLNAMIGRQAVIVAYNDDFLLMTWCTLPTLLLLAMMRRAGRTAGRG
jgi:MFS transporter, DHA2 family, multidrug resistance protein